MKCMGKEGFRTLNKWLDLGRGRKCSGCEDFGEGKVFRRREKIFYRERSEKSEFDFVLSIYIENKLNGLKYLSSTNSRQI